MTYAPLHVARTWRLVDTVPSRDQAPALLGFTGTRCPVTRPPAGGQGSVVSGFQPQRGKLPPPPPRECARLLARNMHPVLDLETPAPGRGEEGAPRLSALRQ